MQHEYKIVRYNNIDVYYTGNLDGGGRWFGQDYLRIISKLKTRPYKIFEWCTGPGFISFSLLANGLCDTLCLADINPKAVEACLKTVEANGLSDRVTVYHSDGLDSIPPKERSTWELVVGNPPHSGTDKPLPWGDKLIYMDADWSLHRRFWGNVGNFLTPKGFVLIQENSYLSAVSDFAQMIEANGLRVVHLSDSPYDGIYYIGAVRAEEYINLRGLVSS